MQESNYLKGDVNNIQQLLIIPCLKDVMMRDLASLLKLCKLRHYSPGEWIIFEGDKDPWIYFLLSGKVRIVKKGVTIIRLDKVGELFGEMRLIDNLPRSASARAEGKTICLAVDTSASHRLDSQEEIQNLVTLFYKIFSKILTQRLRLANNELVEIKKEVERLKGGGTTKKPGLLQEETGSGNVFAIEAS